MTGALGNLASYTLLDALPSNMCFEQMQYLFDVLLRCFTVRMLPQA